MPEQNQEHLRCQFTAVNVPITTTEDGEKNVEHLTLKYIAVVALTTITTGVAQVW